MRIHALKLQLQFSWTAVEVREWMSNYIPLLYVDMIT